MPFLPVNPPLRSCVFVVFSFVHFLSQLFLSVVVLEINSLLSQYITHAILVRPVFYCPYSITQMLGRTRNQYQHFFNPSLESA